LVAAVSRTHAALGLICWLVVPACDLAVIALIVRWWT